MDREIRRELEEIFAIIGTCEVVADPKAQAAAAKKKLEILLWGPEVSK